MKSAEDSPRPAAAQAALLASISRLLDEWRRGLIQLDEDGHQSLERIARQLSAVKAAH